MSLEDKNFLSSICGKLQGSKRSESDNPCSKNDEIEISSEDNSSKLIKKFVKAVCTQGSITREDNQLMNTSHSRRIWLNINPSGSGGKETYVGTPPPFRGCSRKFFAPSSPYKTSIYFLFQNYGDNGGNTKNFAFSLICKRVIQKLAQFKNCRIF